MIKTILTGVLPATDLHLLPGMDLDLLPGMDLDLLPARDLDVFLAAGLNLLPATTLDLPAASLDPFPATGDLTTTFLLTNRISGQACQTDAEALRQNSPPIENFVMSPIHILGHLIKMSLTILIAEVVSRQEMKRHQNRPDTGSIYIQS